MIETQIVHSRFPHSVEYQPFQLSILMRAAEFLK